MKSLNLEKDLLTRGLYATDASMYQMMPVGVVVPFDRDEAVRAIQLCSADNTPVVARGAGTSLTGQSINEAVVLDLSKHMNRILELNLEEGWVRAEPGVVCAELNAFLKPHGVHFAPDPATENRANIGGMIANNSAGMRSVRYGMTIDHVLELAVALATGEVVTLKTLDASGLEKVCQESSRAGGLHKAIREIVDEHRQAINDRYPKVIRRSGGYALDALLDFEHFNLAKLICGSEGTLGVVLEAKLRVSPLPKHSALCLAHFSTIDAALRSAPETVKSGASASELIDGIILRQARQHPLTRDICGQIEGDPAALLVIEVQGDDQEMVVEQARQQAASLKDFAYAMPVMSDPAEMAAVWQMRSSALGLMTTLRGMRKPTPYIEDAAVPPECLADYVADVLAVCERHGQPVSLFGHASVGLIHIRPLHDLHRPDDIEQMQQIQAEVFPLVKKYGGSWSGEHGDGIVRGGYNRKFFGDDLYSAFEQVKRLFDPANLMNPGKIIATPPMTHQLRFDRSKYKPIATQAGFRYAEGGLLAAAEQCSGVGACRKTLSGVMCPTYMATRDELHSTRGRANALRLALSGQLDGKGLASPLLAAAMELCLACTGCKAECPNGVDMARLKVEVLHAQQQANGIRLRTRLFASLPALGRWVTGPQASVINAFLNSKPARTVFGRLFDIDAQKSFPNFANQRLSKWFSARKCPQGGEKRSVVLFNDTYTEYFHPEIGRAAIECLEAAGFDVNLQTNGDSQRTSIALGLLDKAKKNGHELVKKLSAVLESDTPILVCEPSCATALAQDLPDLLDDRELASNISRRVVMIDTFLENELATGRIQFNWRKQKIPSEAKDFIVHTHCHQKTMDGGRSTQMLLKRIPGAIVIDSNAGCCGMAGSFGYEKEHAGLSKRIAEQRLLPALSKAASRNSIVVSNGFSCRNQISALSIHRPIHTMQALRESIEL